MPHSKSGNILMMLRRLRTLRHLPSALRMRSKAERDAVMAKGVEMTVADMHRTLAGAQRIEVGYEAMPMSIDDLAAFLARQEREPETRH